NPPARHDTALQHCGGRYRWATKLAMLYDRWQTIARERPDQLALYELASGQRWTFGELARARPRTLSSWSAANTRNEPLCPQGNGA
ncbi:hypothetical protein, partial [Enterococcus casseliflavus]|uniref:hypothetical protein n=1 Tax=Enterococcus casseliflavus TaxID=37734 RepID=UPI003D10728D